MASVFFFVSACGSDSDSGTVKGSVKVTGTFNEVPKVTFSDDFKADALKVEVITKGTGDKIAKGDSVDVNFWVGTPLTPEDAAYSSFGSTPIPQLEDSDDMYPAFRAPFDGSYTYGSRLLVTGSAENTFQEGGNPQYGVGNMDSVAVVLDLVSKHEPTAEEKAEAEPAAVKDVKEKFLPQVKETDGKVVNMFFKGIAAPKPEASIRRFVVKEGDGEVLTKDMTVSVNYFGKTYKADKPFDESYSKQPAEFPLTGVIKGWTDGLTGVKVGSRVLLSIPPRYGYKDQANGDIPANSTLYFVVDVLSAKKS